MPKFKDLLPHPDKGWGRPGSILFHTLKINECETLEDLNSYVYAVTGEYISLEQQKFLALDMIKEHYDGQSK